MISTDFSVLFLAWDDADPGVAVLGGSALPPTLPLVYQLAAQHPVLAVYPHLPATEAEAPIEPEPAAAGSPPAETSALLAAPAAADTTDAASPLDATTDGPGVHLLAPAGDGDDRPPPAPSRLIGLEDLPPATSPAQPAAPTAQPAMPPGRRAGAANVPAVARSQWPAHTRPRPAAAGQAPAAPYAGAGASADVGAIAPPDIEAPTPPDNSATTPPDGGPVALAAAVQVILHSRKRELFPAPPPAPPHPAAPAMAAATEPAAETPATPALPVEQAASVLPPDSSAIVPAAFDEPTEEMGAAEASDLAAPEDDLLPDRTPPATAAPEAPTPAAAPALAVQQPTLDGLNFRMIQYARRAAQLVDGRQDFGVIYAPGWPAWLAALEIRNRSGQPLVLYAAALPSSTAPTTERGWLQSLERMVLRRATLVLVPDAEALRQLRARHADALGEVRIVPAADETAVQLVLAEVALN